ncbi:hypothetical protein AVEN_271136-1 [Araneus ventricosus]|uniref:Uncharacterized protein n=1 Tax=Araneus ventricosus TaxID=182803 RepID=A0A4Y2E612_ARAVE|nr:hypothetical protein AVEN_271136-1 [Araneus ventricosus]
MVLPKKGNQQEKVHCIRDIQRDVGEMKEALLDVYAFTGCDTVSAIYRKGKIVPFKKVQAYKALHTKLLRFNDTNADPNAMADAGKHFLVSIFGSRNTDDLDTRSHQCYFETIAKQPVHSMFKLCALPLTLAAAKQHSCRAYSQLQQWLNEQKYKLE